MAIIVCPNCGKKVTDRMEKCPHCHAILIEQTEQPIITKETIKASAKDSIVGVASATVITIALVLIWSVIAIIMAGKFMGMETATAVSGARSVFLSENLIILIVGAVLFCVLSVLFNKKSGTQFIIGVIITLLFCMIGFGVQNKEIMNGNVPPQCLMYAKSLSLGFGFAFPMVLGGLSIASYNRTLKKALIMQGILAAIFIVLSVVLDLLVIVVFRMGTQGLSIANLICAITVFGIALISNKEFQQLITPKKLA